MTSPNPPTEGAHTKLRVMSDTVDPADASSSELRSELPTIYIVEGTTGEYSDRIEWLVRAYTCEQDAKDEVGRLTHLWRMLEPNDMWDSQGDAARVEMQKHDPGFCWDYTGTSWRVIECALSDGPMKGQDAADQQPRDEQNDLPNEPD